MRCLTAIIEKKRLEKTRHLQSHAAMEYSTNTYQEEKHNEKNRRKVIFIHAYIYLCRRIFIDRTHFFFFLFINNGNQTHNSDQQREIRIISSICSNIISFPMISPEVNELPICSGRKASHKKQSLLPLLSRQQQTESSPTP